MTFSIPGRANSSGFQEPNRTKELLDILKSDSKNKKKIKKEQEIAPTIIKLQMKIIELQQQIIELQKGKL